MFFLDEFNLLSVCYEERLEPHAHRCNLAMMAPEKAIMDKTAQGENDDTNTTLGNEVDRVCPSSIAAAMALT